PTPSARYRHAWCRHNRMPEANQSRGKLGDMDMLPAGVDATNGRQRACVLRDQHDAHSISPHPPGQRSY
ncbi:MAG TPA: hypothetical protein VJW23_02475, partial [Propionibacteriaceae bacterium]|nr:hypothetical protein [Propionibacteriaceae bacterium]